MGGPRRTDAAVCRLRLRNVRADGLHSPGGGLCFPPVRSVLLCDDRGRRIAAGTLSSARAVQIDRPGRAQALSEAVAVNAVIAALDDPTCP